MRIANNIMAMNTHRFYTSNNSAVSKSAEKLSSGYKINRAGDDAAGLAISEKMRAQIRGLNMAKKNSQDAVSMVQVAEGALQGVHSMLQRMNQLAVQAATGTNDIDLTKADGTQQQGIDRAALQQEFENLQAEIDQVAQTTNFNQLYMLQGTGSAGAGDAATMTATVDPADINVGTPSKTAITAADVQIDGDELVAALGTDAAEGDVNITFVANGADKIDMQVGGKTIATATVANMADAQATTEQKLDFQTADGKSVGTITVKGNGTDTATAAQVQADVANVTAKATIAKADPAATPAVAAAGAAGDADASLGKASFTVDLTGVSMDATGKAALKIGTIVVESDTVAAGDIGDAEKIAAAFDGKTVKVGETTYTATVEGAKVKFTADEAGKQEAGNIPAAGDKIGYYKDSTNTAGAATSEVTLADADIVPGNATADTTPGAIPAGTYRIQVGAEEGTILDIHIDAMNTASLGVAQGVVKIDTQPNASAAITATRNAINKVSTQRAELGAMQNRLEYKIDNLANTSENLSAAESRIRDVDIAEEMTNFTKNNILSQAATAMLAQANSLPQNVLSLLQ